MSQNVELARRAYALLSDLTDRDPNDPAIFDVAFVRGAFDEEFELRLSGGYPKGESVFRGREGFAHMLAMLRDAWAGALVEGDQLAFRGIRGVDANDVADEREVA